MRQEKKRCEGEPETGAMGPRAKEARAAFAPRNWERGVLPSLMFIFKEATPSLLRETFSGYKADRMPIQSSKELEALPIIAFLK